VSAERREPPGDLVAGLVALGVLDERGSRPPMHPLAGGVSSEIWRIDLTSGPVVAKQALAQLRVPGTWFAPVERTRYEIEWMRTAESIWPGLTPRIVAASGDLGVIVMEFLDPAEQGLWKSELLAGRAAPAVAEAVGRRVGTIHREAARSDVRDRFDNVPVFAALRLDPYLSATARAHPDLADRLDGIRAAYLDHRSTLVHGDVSPKNIMVGPRGPVLLDAECATWGDPSFDVAFCATHLLLKMVAVPRCRHELQRCLDALAAGYAAATATEHDSVFWRRTADLTAALTLARVDGLSPAEYLTPDDRTVVRAGARSLLNDPPGSVGGLADRWIGSLPGVQQ
jgi:aminoglycoside phosphotransferase (APT) family kinase protein